MIIKKKHAFFWGGVLFFSQLILWIIDLTAESTGFMNHRIISEQWPWYARVTVLLPGLLLMVYSQYPRTKLGMLGQLIYRIIISFMKVKRSQSEK